MREPGPVEVEFCYLHASGETHWMLSRGSGYVDNFGCQSASSSAVSLVMSIADSSDCP